jgi:hypothetical protein
LVFLETGLRKTDLASQVRQVRYVQDDDGHL